MERKQLWKRGLCFILAFVMSLSVGIQSLPEGIFSLTINAAEKTFSLSQSDLALGINVVPTTLTSDTNFMKNHIYNGSMNLNSYFKVSSQDYSNKSNGDVLKYSDKITRDGEGRKWKVDYRWDLNDTQQSLLTNNSYKLIFEGNAISEYHTRTYWYDWNVYKDKKRWDRAQIGIRTVRGEIWSHQSKMQDSGKAIAGSWSSENLYTDFIEFFARAVDCRCGYSAATGNVFYMVDTSVPRITDAYVCTDPNNPSGSKVSGGDGFSVAGEVTSYVVFEFSEKVRFSDNKGKEIELNLDAYDNKTGVSLDAGKIKAKLVSFEDNRMIFKYTVPSTIDNQPTDIRITGVSSAQSQLTNGSFDLSLYKDNGTSADISGVKSRCYITDIAGNSLNWDDSDRYFGNIYYDNVAPTMTNITMGGSMINSRSKESTDGVDRASIYAGVGDWVEYNMFFSEDVEITTSGQLYMVLNVKDVNGNAIKVKCSKKNNNQLKSERLQITEDLLDESMGGELIYVVGIEGITNVKDRFGNVMKQDTKYAADLSSISLKPAEQITVDVDAPIIGTSLSEANVYTPIASTQGNGEYFTFPIVISEDTTNAEFTNTSWVEPQWAGFSFVQAGESKPFRWYIDSQQSINPEKFQTGTTETQGTGKYTYQPSNGEPAYLHIELDKNIDYTYRQGEAGFYVDPRIYVTITDNAGNTSERTFVLEHQVDYTKPEGSIEETVIKKIDYENLSSSITATFSVTDDLSIKQIAYFWQYTTQNMSGVEETITTPAQTIDVSAPLTKEYKADATISIPFSASEDYGRTGSAQLTVNFKDSAGYEGTVTSPVYTYDFTKADAVYTVKGGSKANPLLIPEVYLSAPVSEGAVEGSRTMMFIPFKTNEDGSTVYLAYDPMNTNGSTGEGTVAYNPALDLIGEVFKYQQTPSEVNVPGTWYIITGRITDGAGAFSNCKSNLNEIYRTIKEYLRGSREFATSYYSYPGVYGAQEIIFVTSANFDDDTFSFTQAESTVESVITYLGNGVNYEAKITGVKDRESSDAAAKYCYEPGNATAPSLDDVEISFTFNNVTNGETEAGYGFTLLDFDNSKMELLYLNTKYSNTSDAAVVYTWPVAKTNNQSVVIPEGVATESGWYALRVTIATKDGKEPKVKVLDDRYLMDTHTEPVSIDSYYKTYKKTEDGKVVETIEAEKENRATWENQEQIEIGLDANAGEGWHVETGMTFTKGYRTSNNQHGIEDHVAMRIYNKNDAKYEEHAIWLDVTYEDEITYTPIGVEEITAESYGTADSPLLPFTDGDNLICVEVLNTNGVITTEEIPVYAYNKCADWELVMEYTQVSERTGGIMEVTVSPGISTEIDLENSTFSYVDTDYAYTMNSYLFREDFEHEFWLLDQNGNLSTRMGAGTDIDGIAPFYVGTNTGTMSDADVEQYFHFNVYAYDFDNAITADELMLTFDADYSAVLLGLTGEARVNNTEQITMKVPLNREKDENGEYLPWESYDTDNYGIYRTRLLHEGPYEEGYNYAGYFTVEIWGVWRYDKDADPNVSENADMYVNADKRTLTLSVVDENGNVQSTERKYGSDSSRTYYNDAYSIDVSFWGPDGTYLQEYDENGNKVPRTDEEGRIGIYSYIPFSKIYSYGASPMREITTSWPGNTYLYTTLPMIQEDGEYVIEFMDLFGDVFERTITVNEFGDVGINLSFSETEYTNQDVTVVAKATLQSDNISYISATTDSGEEIEGTIDEADKTLAYITLPENGVITVRTTVGKERTIPITNIDKVMEPVTVTYISSVGTELDGTEETVDAEVTAMLVCTEEIEGVESSISFSFPRGSKKGDTHTFRYRDRAGNEGTITAVLPCNISKAEQGEAFVDTTAPIFEISSYGMRNNKYEQIADLPAISGMNETGNTAEQLKEAYVQMLTGEKGLGSYVAQAYKLLLNVRDETNTKMIVQKPGSAAPTSYSQTATGSEVQYVSVSKDTITILENVEFDLHVIDEYNNVTSLYGINVTSIDKVAPVYKVTYLVSDDKKSVAAIFVPKNPTEELEVIYPLDKTMESVELESAITDENGDPYMVERYFYTFVENGTRPFNYKDAYGNSGKSEASVQGISTGAPTVTSVGWTGTADQMEPTAQSRKVNKNVVANLNVSKALSRVALYEYDALAADGKGAALDGNAPLSYSFTGTNVFITYTGNCGKVVVELVAAANGNITYYTMPEVGCIDKVAPGISVEATELSDNKRYMTITFSADEAVVMAENTKTGFAVSHTWTATDNEEKVLHFTDEAGNVTEYTITENRVVDTERLQAVFSATENHLDECTNPADAFTLKEGDALWVKTNKAAALSFGTGTPVSVSASTWTKLTLPDTEGVSVLKLTDTNTGEESYKTIAIAIKDRVAPEIHLETSTIVVSEEISYAEMQNEIRTGVTVVDNKDTNLTYEVTGYPQSVEAGLYELIYTTIDASGNKAQVSRTLYIMADGMAVLYVNGKAALPYGRTVIESKELAFETDGFGNEELLTIKIRSGIKSIGQMKRYTTSVHNMETTVSEGGFYTVYVRTQERTEYITYLYVEE